MKGWKMIGLALAITLAACKSVTGPPAYELVLAELASPGYSRTFAENPALEFLPGGKVRVVINTVHRCRMQYSDPKITWDGNNVAIILYEVRGPCDGATNGHLGVHDFNLDFAEEGPARIEILAMYFNRPATFTELFNVDLDDNDSIPDA